MLARADGGDVIVNQEIAAEILEKLDEEVISEKELLRRFFLGKNVDYKIRGAVHAYVMEVSKRRNVIDFILEKALKPKKLEDVKPFVRNLLRIATYEIFFKRVPPALATDCAVRIAKKRFGIRAASFVNAILRKAEKVDLKREMEKLDRTKYLALKYFHPEWYVKMAEKLGIDVEELLIANLDNTIYIRVNTIKTSEENLRRYLEKNDVIVEETFLPEVFKVVSYDKPPAYLDGHNELFVIQDLASCLVSRTLNPEPGDVVADLCAAPGSKTSHMAALMENKGKIIAVDNSKERVERMRARLKKLGVENVKILIGDASKIELEADKVLLDPPCSSTGSVRNYPSVKWRYDPKLFWKTVELQRKMLKNASKIGEEVVYSTCSITFEENEENVMFASKFLKVEDAYIGFGDKGISRYGRKRFPYAELVVRTYPHKHDTAGFFISKLRRK
ncbi:transcription antitermination factor NusB [Ferroglobus sp.]|uniref:transcription antitermination factor NusB n=1 Tax=Ferroglobus sp. TaxID=2614230 RepID=UPI0025BD05C8|nr:RsmB/NOP family class I SAM-dependent RNA methyltransferase [Ferroglobus sp.]